MPKYRKVLEEAVIVYSSNRGFRTIQHSVATYEQTKKSLSYFYTKRIVKEDGVHTKPLPLYFLIIVLIVCPFLYFLNNFFKLLHNTTYIALSHINIRMHNKISAGVLIIRRRNNYTLGRWAPKNLWNFLQKNLIVPKIVAQCQK